jgi:hypothetical protein
MEHQDYTLYLPYKSEVPSPRCDGLVDFHIRVDELINYVGEMLLLIDATRKAGFSTGRVKPILPEDIFKNVPKVPTIIFDERNWDKYRSEIPTRLFYSAVVQLVSHFETFIAELLNDIYYSNPELLAINEKQLTTKEIFEIGSVKKIRHYLKRKMVSKFITKSYPDMVGAFQRNLYIGVHSRHSPFTQKEIHNIIEFRNIIVHNDGQASNLYFDRMSIYESPPADMLEKIGDSVPTNFVWFFTSANKLLGIGNFIDAESQKKWTTTASADWDGTDFDIYFLES